MLMKNSNNLFVAFGIIGIISGVYLLISGDTFIGIFGTITCVFVTLMSAGYIKTDDNVKK